MHYETVCLYFLGWIVLSTNDSPLLSLLPTTLIIINFFFFFLQSINQKRQCVSMQVNLLRKKWHFLCIAHSIGRAFSGGSLLKCYVDGVLVSSEKCRYFHLVNSV